MYVTWERLAGHFDLSPCEVRLPYPLDVDTLQEVELH